MTPRKRYSMIPKISTQQNKKQRRGESGNVFLFILIGIVLFAALSFTMSRGFRSEGTSKLTQRQADLMATEVVNYTQRIERAITKLRQRGCSINDISFDNDIITGYINADSPSDETCHIFKTNGGNVKFLDTVAEGLQPGTGTISQEGIFISASAMGHPNAGEELIPDFMVFINGIDKTLCLSINKNLGIENPSGDPPDASAKEIGGTKFTGNTGNTLNSNRRIESTGGEVANKLTGCVLIGNFSTDPSYSFYSVLVER